MLNRTLALQNNLADQTHPFRSHYVLSHPRENQLKMATSVMTEKLTAGCTFDETQHKNVCNESGGSTRPSLVRAGNETLRLVPLMSLHVVDNTCVIYSRQRNKLAQLCVPKKVRVYARARVSVRARVFSLMVSVRACVCCVCVCVCVLLQ